ncbi:MAG: Gfo/Idh/MocA family oxidoreductase [Planctomycetota bacterium]|nr:Gfo/Idh/MocA family oxidoreductase [Planctomycetota bacterium]
MWLRSRSETQSARFPPTAPIRVGVVGAGFVSSFHLKAIQQVPGARVVGIADIIPERAEQQATRFGIPRHYASLNQLLEDDFDVLHVATPGNTHFELALAGLQARRDVFVEKPFTRTVAQADQLAGEAERQGRRLLVDHSLLGDPRLAKARRSVASGAIGRVQSVQVFRCGKPPERVPKRAPYPDVGDPIREVGVHTFYCISSLLGDIQDIQMFARKTGLQTDLDLDEWSFNLECERGLAHIQLSWNGPSHQVINIRGDEGQLRVDLSSGLMLRRRNWPGSKKFQLTLNPIFEAASSLWQVCTRVAGYLVGKSKWYEGIHEFIRLYYSSLRAGDPMPIDYASVRNVVGWIERLADLIENERGGSGVHHESEPGNGQQRRQFGHQVSVLEEGS